VPLLIILAYIAIGVGFAIFCGRVWQTYGAAFMGGVFWPMTLYLLLCFVLIIIPGAWLIEKMREAKGKSNKVRKLFLGY
jgi:ABC-type transport system involved in Fe-S cluster assembly fused permease/ATPase subunit